MQPAARFKIGAGFDKREVQELPPPGGGEQGQEAAVVGLLRVSAGWQGGAAGEGVAGWSRRRRAEEVPGLHMGGAAGVHTEPLQDRRLDAAKLHPPVSQLLNSSLSLLQQ